MTIPGINEYAVISDSGGMFFIDDETLTDGIAKGYYHCTGYFRDAKNRIVWTYKHIPPPP